MLKLETSVNKHMRNSHLTQAMLGLLLVAACRDISVVGEDFVEGSSYELALTNTIPLDFATMRFDSLITSESNRLLIGGSTGTEFGDFEVESFFHIDLTDPTIDFTDGLVYDSITLSIPLDGYSLYLDDEIVRPTIVVEQVTAELAFFEDQNSLYNYSELPGVTTVSGRFLGEKEFFIASDRLRDIQITLSDVLGRDLFNRLERNDEIFDDIEEARAYLRGLKVYLKETEFVLGLQRDSIELTIHATDADLSTLSNVEISFPIGSTPYFTKYTSSNIPENLQLVDQDDEVDSKVLDNRSFVIGGLGYASKIDLTEVRSLILDGEDFILVDAEIKLSWLEQLHEQDPIRLNAQLVDENLSDLGGQVFAFDIAFDEQYGRDNFYLLDATSIVSFIIDQPIGGEYYLLITAEDFESAPTSVAIGDGSMGSEINIYTIKN